MLRLLPLIALAACLGSPTVHASERLHVVASFSILSNITNEIGGERLIIDTLVGPGEDAHVFDPAPKDAARIAAAKLFIINGLGFEGWINRLIKASGGSPQLVIASDGITNTLTEIESQNRTDPHAWHDVRNVRKYAQNIAKALISIDPDGSSSYQANLARFDTKLVELDIKIRTELTKIPAERRKIVTTHDAFGYFAQAYDIEIIAAQGISTEAEPSAKAIAQIIRQIKSEHIPAVFLENITDPRLAQRISAESGAKIGGKLFSDALSKENESAGTYIMMMETNIRELTKALTP